MNVEGTRDGSRLDDSPLSRSLPSLSSRNFYLGIERTWLLSLFFEPDYSTPSSARSRNGTNVNIGRRANDARESEGPRDIRDEIPPFE